jgi:hypothetical protein
VKFKVQNEVDKKESRWTLLAPSKVHISGCDMEDRASLSILEPIKIIDLAAEVIVSLGHACVTHFDYLSPENISLTERLATSQPCIFQLLVRRFESNGRSSSRCMRWRG